MWLDVNRPSEPVPDSTLLDDLKKACAQLARTVGTPQEFQFPGSQPVSLTRSELRALRSGFVVCEKTDGVRYLLMAWKFKLYLIDRRFIFYPISIPCPSPAPSYEDSVNGTLLDGELVLDKEHAVFYIFDAICVRKQNVSHLSLLNRLRVACSDFLYVMPRSLDLPLVFLLKKMYHTRDTRLVWTVMVPLMAHGNDGLIFTRDGAAYKPGTCRDILKWKPLELNSVDFCCEMVAGRNTATGQLEMRYAKLMWGCGGSLQAADDMIYVDEAQRAELRKWEPRPIFLECVWDKAWPRLRAMPEGSPWPSADQLPKGGFKMHKVREDRNAPNDKSVVEAVMRSVEDNVTIDDVVRAVSEDA